MRSRIYRGWGPAALRQDAPQLCVDAKGFDRIAFHQQLNESALKFFSTHIR
ncbi:hypothetical protein [Pseudomonas sp. MWU13-2100]|uniref:hypothetical protein n=1 Tax=Pseudomonas sp. MWU13-2100 TaxID=2935075 RepID=UPI00200EF552|nr:hypothetical protein [Pseudomonas sp. MWU13-2100]